MASSFNGLVDNDLLLNSQIGYYSPEDANTILKANSNNDLSFMHINIRSLNANSFKLIELISSFSIKLDIIILSEIWNTNINYFSNVFTDYTFVHSIASFQRAGGCSILIHNSLAFSIVDSNNESNYFNNLAEYITIDVIKNIVNFRIYSFYRHPSSVISNFIDSLLSYLRKYKPKSR